MAVFFTQPIPAHYFNFRPHQFPGAEPLHVQWNPVSDTVEVVNLSAGDVPERIHAARVTWTLFPTLQIRHVRGRGFTEEEDRPQGPRVALISHRLWQQRFDADPAVAGRTLTLDGAQHAIVGVMPPGFAYPEQAEVWTPLGLRADGARDRHGLEVVARLADGVNV